MLNVNKTPDWQNLSVLSVNRVPSRAYFIPYKSEEECLAAPFFCDRKEIKSDRFLLLLQPIFPRVFGILHEKDRKFFLSP